MRPRKQVAPLRPGIFSLLMVAMLVLGSVVTVAQPAVERVDSSMIVTQQRIVAHLSGHKTSGHAGSIGVRSTAAERARAAEYLVEEIAALGLTPLHHDYRRPNINGLVDLLLSPYKGTNIYAIVEATSPNAPYVVVGAHYDTVPESPGAIDNASGVALVYALAQKLSQLDERHLNFILVFFDQEEDDEVGSQAFAEYLLDASFDVHSVHITDLVGWDEDGDRAVEVQSPGPFLEQAYQQAADRLGLPLHVTEGASSDNKSFLDAGYRTVGVWEEWDHDDSTPHLHKSSDTYETVDFAYLASTTALVFDVLIHF